MLAIALIVGGCSETTSSVPPTGTTGTTGTTPQPGVTTVTVGGNGSLSYSPASVTINQGDTVHWVWSDTGVAHTVTSGSPGAADGQFCSLGAGMTVNATTCNSVSYAATAPFTYDHVFSAPGTYPYYCTVHGAVMTGTVTVMATTTGTTGTTSTGGTTGSTTGTTGTTGGTGGY
jgi:plastocyanin